MERMEKKRSISEISATGNGSQVPVSNASGAFVMTDYNADGIPYDNNNSVKDKIDSNATDIGTLSGYVADISDVIPSTATSSNQLATQADIPSVPTAYASNPAMDGTASPGSSTAWAKGDHVHPSDTSKVNKNGDTMTGALTVQGNITSTGSITDGSGNVLSNKADNTQTFTEASTRANIDTGETMPTLFGKIKKWFADLADLAFISKDGTSSTKYLRGDGTWQTFPNYAGSSSQGGAADSVAKYLRFYWTQGGSSESYKEYKGNANLEVKFKTKLYTVNASNWSATVDANGYYTNTMTVTLLNTYLRPIIAISGSTVDTVPTAAQKAAYNLCDVFYFADGTQISSMTVKAKTKPTETFYVTVQGLYIQNIT